MLQGLRLAARAAASYRRKNVELVLKAGLFKLLLLPALAFLLYDTPERRKQTVQEVALAITKPGDNVSDKAIREELKRRGMKLIAGNPTATISTILHGFKSQFTKVEGKRGVFKRRE